MSSHIASPDRGNLRPATAERASSMSSVTSSHSSRRRSSIGGSSVGSRSPSVSSRSSSISSSHGWLTAAQQETLWAQSKHVWLSWVNFLRDQSSNTLEASLSVGGGGMWRIDLPVVDIATGKSVSCNDFLRLGDRARHDTVRRRLLVRLGDMPAVGAKWTSGSEWAERRLYNTYGRKLDDCKLFGDEYLLATTRASRGAIMPVLNSEDGSNVLAGDLWRILAGQADLLEDSCHDALYVRVKDQKSRSDGRRRSSAGQA